MMRRKATRISTISIKQTGLQLLVSALSMWFPLMLVANDPMPWKWETPWIILEIIGTWVLSSVIFPSNKE